MEIGFIGLGSMGGPMSRRLVEAGHKLTVFDTRKEAMEPLIKLGAEAARSPADVADRVETVLTSLPSLDIGMKVVSGDDGLIRGNRVRRYVDLSTTGSRAAVKTAEILKQRNIVQIDSPVSGGVAGAEKGTLAVMVSGPLDEIEHVRPALEGVRQGVRLRRPGGPRAEHEARQQLPLRHRHGGKLGSDRDGRQGRARSEPDVRRHQRRQRHEHGDHAEVSALGAARHVRLRLRHGA